MNFYKRYPGDYARDTGHLSLAGHGAYALLLDRYYSVGNLPNNMNDIYTLCRATTKTEREAVQKVLSEFFPDGKNHRADEEIEKWTEKATQNREIGKLGGRPKRNPDANPEETQTVTETVSRKNPLQNPDSDSVLRTGDPPPDPPDPRKAIFDLGVSLLGEKHRSLIGKAVSVHGDQKIGAILGEMAAKPPVDPVSYFAKATQKNEQARFKSA